MAKSSMQRDLMALHRLVNQADLVLATTNNPDLSIVSARDLLITALALSKDLTKRQPDASALGARGGKKTAERGPEYFKQIAAMRKKLAGGRPRKRKD